MPLTALYSAPMEDIWAFATRRVWSEYTLLNHLLERIIGMLI
jgi:hypothetical protein